MTTIITASDSRLLINALGANGAFSTLSGLIMLLAPGSIAEFLGIDASRFIFELGVMLLLFGGVLLIYFYRRRIRRLEAVIISLLDFGWVAGSAVLLRTQPDLLSRNGAIAVIAVAIIVLTFLDMQLYALWKHHRSGRQGHAGIGASDASAN